jgi:hypothetical protein
VVTLRGAVLKANGTRRIEGQIDGPVVAAVELGQRLAERLLAQGARELLA